ncbi:MAG: anaerobic ribonucleoside-triphosphate reductase [Nitrososphaeria archaeon]
MSDDFFNLESVYSALGSNERLTILRELSKSGSLSYTELKNNCGFIKKRESGRFAYHLRLLSSVNLILLNKNTRKYSLTPFGRNVLTVTNELKDAALQSSGKIYVRTSRHKIEEFDSNKIYQSLIREANVPRDLASKITAEAESRISKLENVHLTAPLLRELVNSILVEKGLDEYRNKLTRLGLPVKDVTDKIYQIGHSEGDVLSLRLSAADAVFTDYLLLTQIGSESLDMHLSGDISIVNTGCWGIMPDSIFFDALSVSSFDMKFGIKSPSIPRIRAGKDFDTTLANMGLIIKRMLDEVSDEITIENFVELVTLTKNGKDCKEIVDKLFYNLFLDCVSKIDPLSKKVLSFQINLKNDTELETLEEVLGAYLLYLKTSLRPKIKLVVNIFDKSKFKEQIKLFLESITSGGNLMIVTKPERSISYQGIKKGFSKDDILPVGTINLHSLAINLPRLSYSGAEESYLKSLLKIRLQKASGTMKTRKDILISLIERKLLYFYEYNSDLFSKKGIDIVLNMVGLDDLARYLVPQDLEEQNKMWLKMMEFSQKILEEEGERMELKIAPSIYTDTSAERFYELDKELFPKTPQGKAIITAGRYTQIPVLDAKSIKDESVIRMIQTRMDITKGGYHTVLDLSTMDDINQIQDIIEQAIPKLGAFKIRRDLISCGTCNSKSPPAPRCPKCGSAEILSLQTDN